jgi:hypothetical protein
MFQRTKSSSPIRRDLLLPPYKSRRIQLYVQRRHKPAGTAHYVQNVSLKYVQILSKLFPISISTITVFQPLAAKLLLSLVSLTTIRTLLLLILIYTRNHKVILLPQVEVSTRLISKPLNEHAIVGDSNAAENSLTQKQ